MLRGLQGLQRYRLVYAVLLFLFVASCSGGGCSGCSGCGGTTPLPGGFPKSSAIQNAASVRLTRPGLDFVEQNLPTIAAKVAGATNGAMTFDVKATVPKPSSGTIKVGADICPDGPTATTCKATIGIAQSNFKLDAVTAHALKVRAVVPLVLSDTKVKAHLEGPLGVSGDVTIHVGYGANGSCGSGGSANATPYSLPLGVTIPLVAETTSPRDGYSKIDVENATIDMSGLGEDQVQLCGNCGGGLLDSICDGALGLIKGYLVDQLKDQLDGQVKKLLEDQLCTAPTANLNPPCPTGSEPDSSNKKCVYSSNKNTCVPTLLGTDAHIDLGGFLASLSPGASGALDFGLAAGGDMNPAPGAAADGSGRTINGVSLTMMGGVVPQPISKCVPDGPMPTLPTGIPVPDELAPAKADPAGSPHVGIALAGRFLDYSLASVYKSGALCLGLSTEQVSLLKSGLLSLIIPSIKTLTFEEGDAAAAIATRPQGSPSVKVGGGTNVDTDPLITITLPKFALDFYVWSYDRYVRALTFQADLSVPVNLQTGKDGLTPVIGKVGVGNPQVTNADLLSDDPKAIAGAVADLLSGFSKQLLGAGFSPIDLSSALKSYGMGLDVNSIKKLSKGSDDFVGVFASLKKTTTATVEADTRAVLVSKTVHADKMQLGTMTADALPELVVEASSPVADGVHQVEYSWQIDKGTRSAWARDSHIVIRDEQLLLQGKHVLSVFARVADEPGTEDATPAEIPYTVDALAPFVKIETDDAEGKATVKAWDLVSSKDSLLARVRFDGAPWGEFRPLDEIGAIDVGSASSMEVQVQDEEGNIGTVSQPLIRGRADSSLVTGGSGCGSCEATGAPVNGGGRAALAVGLAGLALILFRRRRLDSTQRLMLAVTTVGAVAASAQGCACGSEAASGPACGDDCNSECKPPLTPGMAGAYLSLAKASDGTIWVAGYDDALITDGDAQLLGDLVVGKYDSGKQSVDWETVDGVPARTQGCAPALPDSFRHGEMDSGDDVGLWTSMQVTKDDHPIVSYYDATNHQLKVAVNDGGWSSFVLRAAPANGDAGRYSKMVIDGDKPVIAFLQYEPGTGGKTRSRVVVAKAKSTTPHGPEDFTLTDAAVIEDNPCSSTSCGAGQACLTDGTCAKTTGGCTPADCGTDKACVTKDAKASCESTKGTIVTYPDVFGDYIALAVAGGKLGIALYDRPHGNLVALEESGSGPWKQTIVDGETGDRAAKTAIDTGDTGIGTSLFIDSASTWHITYVNGLDETLRYITYAGGKPGKSEIIDDGSSVDGKGLDGRHFVGDDSAVQVDGDVVSVYYQDATAGVLRRATGTKNGTTHKWDLRSMAQPNKSAGYFPRIVPGEKKVANFWKQIDKGSKSATGDVTILSP